MEYPKPVPNDPAAREARRKNRPPPSYTVRLSERLGTHPPPYRNSVSELMSRLERDSGDIADCSHILRERIT